MKVICHKNGAESKVFTDGKVYETELRTELSENSRLKAIRDDRGNLRYIIPGEPCPHLVFINRLNEQRVVGHFEVINE